MSDSRVPVGSAAREHPRPDFRRCDDRWTCLDGTWELALDGGDDWCPVRVPSPWESALSGVGAQWIERVRYRRRLHLPPVSVEDTVIVHFQAVHHRAEVIVDGVSRVVHVGGQLPFEVDVSDRAGSTISLEVVVDAPIDKAEIPHGKQRSIPADPYDVCSFTPCSGIWQSVWLERRPRTHLRSVRFVPRAALDGFAVSAVVTGEVDRVRIEVVGSGERVVFTPGETAELLLDGPRIWWPDDPQLYELIVTVERDGRDVDTVVCTSGLRTVQVVGSELRLNGSRIHLRGVLDQGYWPRSGWTAPDDAALTADLVAARAAGFNLIRKHLKLEDPRWLHGADRLGLLVWEEPPSVSHFTADSVAAFEDQLGPMVERDANHPSIVIWGIYNEEWGLDWDVPGDPEKGEALRRAYRRVVTLDPTRPVVDNSGWSHVQTDLVDWHVYAPDVPSWRAALQGLDGGFDVDLGPGGVRHRDLFADASPVAGRAMINSEYGTGRTSVERAWVMRWQTQELRRDERSNGYVYCELYDVEHEIAGVLTHDRQPKDTLGLEPSDTHGDTVFVLDVDPIAPGLDLVTGTGAFEVTARVSSHGATARDLRVLAAWRAPLGSAPDPPPDAAEVARVRVQPFVLSEPVTVSGRLPVGTTSARLHLWLVPVDGAVRIAHTVLDVRLGPAASSLH